MAITKSTYHDLEELEELINSAYRGESSKKGWTTEADLLDGIRITADSLEKILANNNATLLQFTADNNCIQGCVYLEKKNNKMYLGMLTVSPLQQAKGIGKKLLLAAEEYAREHHTSVMQMTVISVREELIKWYERHGYKSTGVTQPFPADERFGIQKKPLEFIIMEKRI